MTTTQPPTPTQPPRLAPELIEGGPATAASDVYGFGIIMWGESSQGWVRGWGGGERRCSWCQYTSL